MSYECAACKSRWVCDFLCPLCRPSDLAREIEQLRAANANLERGVRGLTEIACTRMSADTYYNLTADLDQLRAQLDDVKNDRDHIRGERDDAWRELDRRAEEPSRSH